MGNCFSGEDDDGVDYSSQSPNETSSSSRWRRRRPVIAAGDLRLSRGLELDVEGDLEQFKTETRKRADATAEETTIAAQQTTVPDSQMEIRIEVEEESAEAPQAAQKLAVLDLSQERVPSRSHRLNSPPPVRPLRVEKLMISPSGVVRMTRAQLDQLVERKIIDVQQEEEKEKKSQEITKENKENKESKEAKEKPETSKSSANNEKSPATVATKEKGNSQEKTGKSKVPKEYKATLRLKMQGTLKLDQISQLQAMEGNSTGNSSASSAASAAPSSPSAFPCTIDSYRVSFPADTSGFFLHLTGRKPASFAISQSWVNLVGDSFWSLLLADQPWPVKMALKIFRSRLPMKCGPKRLKVVDFPAGQENFSCVFSLSGGEKGKSFQKQFGKDKIIKILQSFIAQGNPLIGILFHYKHLPGNLEENSNPQGSKPMMKLDMKASELLEKIKEIP